MVAKTTTFQQFKKQFDAEIGAGIAELGKQLAISLPQVTPSKTGLLKTNWIPTVQKTRPRPQPVANFHNQAQFSELFQKRLAGLAKIARYKLDRGDLFLVNSTRYATVRDVRGAINVPARWVERGIAKAIQKSKLNATFRRQFRRF